MKSSTLRNVETSVVSTTLQAIISTLVSRGILMLANLLDPTVIINPTNHINLEAHLLKETDHHSNWNVILVLRGPVDTLNIIIPVSIIPMVTITMDTIPMVTIMMDSILMITITIDTVLMVIITMDTVLMVITAMDLLPMNIIPLAMISKMMGPVIQHHTENVFKINTHHPNITITVAIIHLLGTQKRKVQAKDILPFQEDKMGMSTDSLHWRKVNFFLLLKPISPLFHCQTIILQPLNHVQGNLGSSPNSPSFLKMKNKTSFP